LAAIENGHYPNKRRIYFFPLILSGPLPYSGLMKSKRIALRPHIGFWIIALFLFFFNLTWSGNARAEKDEDLDGVLSKLRERFAAAKTFQADYTRELVPKVASKLPASSLRAEGHLSFRSPNKLRLEQKKPRAEKLICNGDKVWWYLPEEKVVNVYRLQDYYLQIKPIMDFLSGLGGLDKNFTVRLDTGLPEEAPFYQLLLKPKNPQPDLQQIMVRLGKHSFLPLEFSFENLMGDNTRFRFSQIQTGVTLAVSFFEFTPPEGTQVNAQTLPSLPKK
jgi:outer membrane lipoprotein carrier protein